MARDVLGIDIGGVIVEKIDRTLDTSFDDDFVNTPAVTDAISSIKLIMERRFGNNTHLISKCGTEVEALTRHWLDANFFKQVGFDSANIHFCERRQQKAPICEALGVTHFIDDRLEVLSYLETVANRYLFQPTDAEVARFSKYLDRVHPVYSWNELVGELLGRKLINGIPKLA